MLGVVDTITVVVGALQIVVPEGLDVGTPVGVQSNDFEGSVVATRVGRL